MAAVTDPRAVAFSNQQIRPSADLLVSLYWTAKKLQQNWTAQQMGTLIPFTSDLIVDGASVDGTDAVGGDGRPLMTCSNAEQIFNILGYFINVMERGTVDNSGSQNFSNLNLAEAVAVNGKSLL